MNTGKRSNLWSQVLLVALFLGAVVSIELSLGSIKVRSAALRTSATTTKTNQASIQSTDESRIEISAKPSIEATTTTGLAQSSASQTQSSAPESTNKVEVNAVSTSVGDSTTSSQTVVNSSSSSSTFSQSQTSIQTSGDHVSISQ